MIEKRWLKHNVNLDALTSELSEFFINADFEAAKGETEDGSFQIVADDSSKYKMQGAVLVTIKKEQDELVITLERQGVDEKKPLPPIFPTTMLGGGYFLLKRLKSDENWLKLQRDFWRYAESVASNV